MGCYVSSNNERVYVALESAYGEVPAITAANRIPLLNLGAKQVPVVTGRKDKTGSRTFVGLPNTIRRTTSFTLNTLMTEWVDQTRGADRGAAVSSGAGSDAGSVYGRDGGKRDGPDARSNSRRPHGLTPGRRLLRATDIRFVAAVANSTTVFINAPFTITPTAGAAIGATMTYNAGGGSAEREHFRLLGSERGGAANCERRGDGQADDQGERRFSGVRFFGAVAGFAGQRQLHQRAGRADGISGRAGADGLRLHDHPGESGAGVDGGDAEPSFSR